MRETTDRRAASGRSPRRRGSIAAFAFPLASAALASLALAFALVAPLATQSGASETPLEYAFRFPSGGAVLASPEPGPAPLGADAVIWVLSDDRYLHAVAETGTVVGKYRYEGKVSPFVAPTAYGQACIVLDGATLVAVTPSGTAWFRARLPARALAAPAAAPDGRLYVPLDGALACLSGSGTLLWTLPLPGLAAAVPVLDPSDPDGGILARVGREVLRVSPYGETTGRYPQPSKPLTTLAFREDGQRFALAGCEGGELALADGSGEVVTLLALPSRPSALARLPSGDLAALCEDGALRLIRRESRDAGARATTLWESATGVKVPRASLVAVSDRLVATARGAAAAVGFDGTVWRQVSLRNSVVDARFVPSGLLCSAGADWVMAAYRFERPGLWSLKAASPPRLPPDARGPLEPAYSSNPRFFDRDWRLSRLREFAERLVRGAVGPAERTEAPFCAAVASGDTGLAPGSGSADARIAARDTRARVLACSLLGSLGHAAWRPLLLELARSDDDAEVRAAAARALGSVGWDLDGEAARVFLWRYETRRTATGASEATAWIDAILGFYRFAGSVADGASFELLVSLALDPRWPEVRRRAIEAIDSLPDKVTR